MSQQNYQLKVAADALVCETSIIQGEVTIGSKTIVHPRARIIAQDGPIIIGNDCLIEENSTIINKNANGVEGESPLVIGNNNVFGVGCTFEGKSMGDNNVIEAKASVSPLTEIGSGTVIATYCQMNIKEKLPDRTCVYGDTCQVRKMAQDPLSQREQSEFLRKVLPNYHRFKQST